MSGGKKIKIPDIVWHFADGTKMTEGPMDEHYKNVIQQERELNNRKGQAARESSARGGRKSKRKEWAEWAGNQVQRWDEIPDSEHSLEYQGGEIYKDGNSIIHVDGRTGKESSLAKSTFLKRYLKKHFT